MPREFHYDGRMHDIVNLVVAVMLLAIGVMVGSIWHGISQPAADCSMCFCKAVASAVI